MNKLKLLDLFSGIGGFSLGLESTGYFQTIAFVEKDKFCRQVLQKNFNNIPIEEDIRNVRGSNYAADVITGGFPCQPFSVAGKRKGTADDRYLWDETIRVVAECKPRWFIGENVEGLININNGMVLRQVQTDLEEQGFQVQCIVIPASGIGAWHQRKRIWIVAYSDSNRHSNKIRGSSTKEERISQEHRQDHNTTRKSSGASSVWETNNQHVPNSSGKRSSSQSIGVNRELAEESKGKKETRDQSTLCTSSSCSDVSNSDSKLSNGCGSSTRNSSTKFKGMECNQSWNWNEVRSKAERCSEQNGDDVPNSNGERPQGYKLQHDLETGKQISEHDGKTSSERQQTWWQTQSEFCGVPNGISYELDKDRSSRIKALGNSIVPQIARQIGLSIIKAELN
jgi:DNA (cytosine-5)-methyltransferase 1